MRSDKLKAEKLEAELAQAKKKASHWQARVREIERQIVEHENNVILQAVRGVATTPEELRGLLDMIRAASAKEPPAVNSEQEEKEFES